jgi:antitoxin VapB
MALKLTQNSGVAIRSYMKSATGKLFQHGGSQALRLPKDFRLPGTVAKLSKTPRGILVQPVEDTRRRARQFAKLEGSCPEFPDIEPPRADRAREPLA